MGRNLRRADGAPGTRRGRTGFITVNSQCAWTAQSNAPWITVLSGATGAGIGRVDVCAPPNPTTATRTGTLTIAGLTVRVDQAAGTGTGTTPTDPEIVAGVVVRAQHLADLRSRIQALRSRFKLAAYQWMDDPLSATVTQIRAVHITQLRQALADVYVAARLCPPTYTDSSLTAGMTIKAAHVAELRAAVNAIE